MFPTYTPSGRIGWRRLWRLPVYGGLWMAALGALYGYVLTILPFDILGPLVTLIFAFTLAAVVSRVNASVHCRSVRFATVFGLIQLVAAFWVRWLVCLDHAGPAWAAAFMHAGPLNALEIMARWAHELAELDPDAWSPRTQMLVWTSETLVVAFVVLTAARDRARDPFSEAAGRWGKTAFRSMLNAGDRPAAQLMTELSREGVTPLLSLPLAPMQLSDHETRVRLIGTQAAGDEHACWLSITIARKGSPAGQTRAGQVEEVLHWQVPDEAFARLEARLNALDPTVIVETSAESALLDAAREALAAGDATRALAEARRWVQHDDPALRQAALEVCVQAQERLEQWGGVLDHGQVLIALAPTAPTALALACAAACTGDRVRTDAWFALADRLNVDTPALAPAMLRIRLLDALADNGAYADVAPHLNWLRNAYAVLRHSDPETLTQHALPALSGFLTLAWRWQRPVLDADELKAWYAPLRPAVDETGRQAIDPALAGIAAESDEDGDAAHDAPVILFRHHTRVAPIGLDCRTGDWFALPEEDPAAWPAGEGCYTLEGGVCYSAYWHGARFYFGAGDRQHALFERGANGVIRPCVPGPRLRIDPIEGETDHRVRLMDAGGQVLHALSYCATRYAAMAAFDFTAASMVEDLSDWDFFLHLENELRSLNQQAADTLAPLSGGSRPAEQA